MITIDYDELLSLHGVQEEIVNTINGDENVVAGTIFAALIRTASFVAAGHFLNGYNKADKLKIVENLRAIVKTLEKYQQEP